MDSNQARFDVIISGGSFTGLALARALSTALGQTARIAIIEKSHTTHNSTTSNPRAFSISASSKQMLDALGAWQAASIEAQPVTNIEITDSSLEAGIRPTVLRYENTLENGTPASYIVPDPTLVNSLRNVVNESKNIEVFQPASIKSVKQETGYSAIQLDDDRQLRTKLLVAAEGRRSPTRDDAGIKLIKSDYSQLGIVARITHEKPHNASAIQHFLPGGPFAILPMTGNRSNITWSQDTITAKEILALDDDAFLNELEKRIKGRLGKIALDGPRRSWPLSAHLARTYIAKRLALIGDTAHGVHPIAGQGVNLGLRDAAALAQVTAESWRLGMDIGEGLEKYQRWRRFDSTMSTAAFDGLNRLFSNDWTLLRSARSAGLAVVDRIKPLKQIFVTEAAGPSGNVPRLLKGEAI